ncbi:MAG: hypothetical protein AAGK14_14300 [Verrucomicrobiota bacterium]
MELATPIAIRDEIKRHSPWVWVQLLSLDAVAVAVVWQGFLGAYWEVPLGWADRVVLALTVWLVYVADRLFDAGRGKADTLRHVFYGRHRMRFLAAMLVVAPLTALLALIFLSWTVLIYGTVLAGVVALYLWALQRSSVDGEELKPITVGVIFTLGCALAPLAHLPVIAPWHVMLLVFFTLAAVANCLVVAWWEEQEANPKAERPELWALFFYLFYGILFYKMTVESLGQILRDQGQDYWGRVLFEVSLGAFSLAILVPFFAVMLVSMVFSFTEPAEPASIKSLRTDFATLLPAAFAWAGLVLTTAT